MFTKYNHHSIIRIILSVFILLLTFHTGAKSLDMGVSASMAMPSGIVASAGMPGPLLNQVNIAYGASSNLIFVVDRMLQFEAGFGYATVSTIVPKDATEPDPQSVLSIMAGGKYFLKTGTSGHILEPG
jgi:hypothetical protein